MSMDIIDVRSMKSEGMGKKKTRASMDYHVAPDCAISHSIHSPVSRETYPVCKLADVGYCMERLEFTPIEPRTWTMWWSRRKEEIDHPSPFSTSHLVPLSTMRGRMYVYTYIHLSFSPSCRYYRCSRS